MSGLQRIVRHPDRLNDPHTRAVELASEALLASLDETDAAWLEEHLALCEACRRTVDAFSADAALLHGLRDDLPPVPRDLGARVSQALDDEVRRATRGRRGAGSRGSAVGRSRRPRLAFAGLAAVAVVALLVGPLAVPSTAPSASLPPTGSLLPAATPILVNAQPVAWASRGADGAYTISSAQVGQVCPATEGAACGTLDGSVRTLAALNVKPSSMTLPRDGSPAVVVGQGAVYAVPVNLVATASAAPRSSPAPTNVPVQTPAASGGPATPPAGSPAPSEPVASPTSSLSASPSAGPSGGPSATPQPSSAATPEPSRAATPAASPVATPVPTLAPATPLPTLPPPTPAPSPAAALKIADNVVLIGTPPAYSPDGRWVAFSARPTDGSHGPDIYAWEVGRQRAIALTTDHASVFSGWLNDRILGSTVRVAAATPTRTPIATPDAAGGPASTTSPATSTPGLPSSPVEAPGPLPGAVPAPDADPATVVARSFLLDPAHDMTAALPLDGVWRPVVDPTGRTVVYWTGAFAWSDVERTWVPALGGLAAATWRTVLVDGAVAAPQALPGGAAGPRVTEWDVRFDPAGRRLGVWVADPAEPGAGRLALVTVNDDGTLGDTVLADQSALPGFSLDADRLAWSTPPGRNGEGSLVTVFAWNGDAAGQVQTMPNPGNDPLVVSR